MVILNIVIVTSGLHPRPVPPTRSLEAATLGSSSGMLVCGVDEAGRGAIAGPIVAAAVWMDPGFDQNEILRGHGLSSSTRLHDSKLLSATERIDLYRYLRCTPRLVWATAAVPANKIDDLGVVAANEVALGQAVGRLAKRLAHLRLEKRASKVNGHARAQDSAGLWCLVDGDSLPSELKKEWSSGLLVQPAGGAAVPGGDGRYPTPNIFG